MTTKIFDEHSGAFTRQIDEALKAGTYLRGRLFVEAVAGAAPQSDRVLDYGCGPGRISHLLAARGYSVEGFDPAETMIAAAREANPHPERACFEARDDNGDSLESGRYGAVVCSSVIEFVPDPAALLRNLFRATKPGALLALSFSNRRSLWRAYSKLQIGRKLPHFSVQYNAWTLAQAKLIIEAAGFSLNPGAVYFEASPFDKRPALRFLSASRFVGTLGFVTARRN